MELFIAWIGFAGAWLLFAGPIYQAALELKEQDIEFERIRLSAAHVPKPTPVSPWWWLLPPVKLSLEKRRSRHYRQQYIKALSAEDAESLVSFMSKATAWLLVAAGGLCIAVKETYELAEHEHWAHSWFWLVVVVMLLVSIANVITRLVRSKQIIKSAQ